MVERLRNIYMALGPGILLAATAIGVSHLVQSVQAGAQYGYFFIIMILLAHIIKYPFFEAAPRYSSVTKRSLLYGYYLFNPKYLIIYLILTLLSMFTVIAAVTIVAGGILANIIPVELDIKVWSTIILMFCTVILLKGKYELLDKFIKPILILLAISTLVALFISFAVDIEKSVDYKKIFNFNDKKDILFLIAFLGWMPCPMDCSVWNSIWVTEKKHNHPQDVYYKKSILDFRIGFIATALLGVVFLMLGQNIFYGTNVVLSQKTIGFVGQVLNIYTVYIGQWAFGIIALAALCTMFSTVITCLDGFSRIIAKIVKILRYDAKNKKCDEAKIYPLTVIFSLVGTLIIFYFFLTNMKSLIYIATITSFLSAPFFAWFNLKLITDKNFPKQYQPSRNYVILCYIFIAILILFALGFLLSQMF